MSRVFQVVFVLRFSHQKLVYILFFPTCHMTRLSRPPEATHYVIVSFLPPSTTICSTLPQLDSPSSTCPQTIIEWKTRLFLCATWRQRHGVEAVLHSCQLRRYMEVSCQFHTPADLPSRHSLTTRLRAPGSRPAHSGEHIPPIETRFLGNPARGVVPILTELPLFIFLLKWKASGRAARRSPVGPVATLPDRPCCQTATCETRGHLTWPSVLPDGHLWDPWPPYLTVPLSHQTCCYIETSSNEGSHFLMCDAVNSGKFDQIADELGASTFRVECTEDRTLFRDLPISVPNHTASSQ